MYHAILDGGIGSVSKVCNTTGYGTSLGSGQVRCVYLQDDMHFGFFEYNGVVWVCCCVLQETYGLVFDCEGWLSLQ
jgi:hypothetical protein